MPKMTLKQKRDLLVEICGAGDELKTNKSLIQETIQKRLAFVPNKKLYKFRACSNDNFRVLNDNCIWMSLASGFNDAFDNTINIDPKENIEDIQWWSEEKYPVLFFDYAKHMFAEKGIYFPYTHEDFNEYRNACFDDKLNLVLDKAREYLFSHATTNELEHIEDILQALNLLREKIEDIEAKAYKDLSHVIDLIRVSMREKALVYCMTERYDNHTLWENYAKNYTGFCIEYSFSNFEKKDMEHYKNLVYLFPMTYTKKKPCFNIVPVIDGALNEAVNKDESWKSNAELNADLNLQLLYKKIDYEYEHEWRFAIDARNENKQEFPFVSAIYAGKDIKPLNLSRLKKIAGRLKVPIYKQEINSSMNGYDYKLIK